MSHPHFNFTKVVCMFAGVGEVVVTERPVFINLVHREYKSDLQSRRIMKYIWHLKVLLLYQRAE